MPQELPTQDSALEDSVGQLSRVQSKLVDTLHALQLLPPHLVKDHNRAVRAIQEALTLVGDTDDSEAIGPIDWVKFGERLQKRRTAAGLTQEWLADRVGVTATTIRQLEHHNRKARRSLMLKLLAVPELNLRVSDIELSAELSAGYRHTPTSWLGPTYDPMSMVTELADTLNGQSGQLEQTLVYIDPQSAKDWMTTCSSPEYGPEYRDSMPLPTMARRIAELVGEHALTVNALGCGDGRTEALLTKYLQHQLRMPKQTELFLLDVSHSLLNAAYRHCCEALPEIRTYTIHGSFLDLPKMPMLVNPLRGRSRLFAMLGLTLVNLNDSTSETVTAGDDLTYVQAAVASDHIVLLRSNGTAVAYPTPTSFMPPPDYGQLTIPVLPNAMTYTQVAAGRGFTVLLRSDGTVLTFGKKDANYTDVPPLPPGMTYTEISASDNSAVALALRSDGAVVEFGNDNVLTTVPNPPAGVVYTHIYAGLDGAAVAATSHTVGLSAGPDTLTLNEDTGREVTVLANDIDPEGHPLTVTDVTPGLHGTTWVNPDGSISYTPALDYYGLDAFAYTLSNGVTSVIGGVTVKVDQVNDAPRVQDAVFNGVTAGSVLTASLADKVSDPDPPVPPFNGNLQVLVVTQPSLGSLVISGFTDFTYTAPTDLGGATSTSFIYLVTGGSGASDYATVTINFI